MDDDDLTISQPPHALVFPSPVQSPINAMFDIAELLCLAGLDVTFLLTPYTKSLLFHHVNIDSRLIPYPLIRHIESHSNPNPNPNPSIRLHTISDGLPPDHPQSNATELLDSMETFTKPVFKDLLTSDECGPVSCIISDGYMTFVYDVANELQVPVISVWSISPCSLWVLSNLLDPTEGVEVFDSTRGSNADSLCGMNGILTKSDLASMCQSSDWNHHTKDLRKQGRELSRAHGLILNTFKALDGPILSHIHSICPNLYPIGPIHTHLAVRQEAERLIPLLNYSCEENNDCITWLDLQQPKSVLYVNIENHAQLKWVQIRELWHGLVNSGTRFLWVRRAESILEEGRVPPKILEGTKERGCIVDLASNVHVLAHKSIGGFLTCGQWDSIIQGIVEGVPTICCPSSLDQQVNIKFVSIAWKIGLDVEWRWDRNIIEKMIRDVMELKGELIDNANKMKYSGRKSVRKGGSSYARLNQLIDEIRCMRH